MDNKEVSVNKWRRDRNAERRGDFLDVDEADVAMAAFDSPHVRPVKVTGMRQGLLRQSSCVAQLAKALAEIRLDRGIQLVRQAVFESPMLTLSPRTLGIMRRTSFLPSVVL